LHNFKDKENDHQFSEIKEMIAKDYADVMEAYISAVFLDSGNISETFKIFRKVMNPDFL
jgi:hypothetical protein